MSIKINVNVSNPATVLLSFGLIRVKRSTDGVDGTYEYITALAPAAATLLAPTDEAYDVVGKTLSLKRDSHDQVDVLFTGTQPLTANQVGAQIDTALGVAVSSNDSDALRLTSTITGTASKFEIVGGSAAAEFGWTAGDRDIGEDAHITLLGDQSLYEYVDNDGAEGYYYKVNYYNSGNGQSSLDSSPFLGSVTTLVGADSLSIAKVDLVDARGVAIPNQEITFYSTHEPLTVDGFQVALVREPVTITTDNAGHAEVPLIRGLKVKVVFEGTSLIRDITVPDQASFDILDAMGNAPDPYGVSEPSFPFAIRRTT